MNNYKKAYELKYNDPVYCINGNIPYITNRNIKKVTSQIDGILIELQDTYNEYFATEYSSSDVTNRIFFDYRAAQTALRNKCMNLMQENKRKIINITKEINDLTDDNIKLHNIIKNNF
jgi:hypothetical protein